MSRGAIVAAVLVSAGLGFGVGRWTAPKSVLVALPLQQRVSGVQPVPPSQPAYRVPVPATPLPEVVQLGAPAEEKPLFVVEDFLVRPPNSGGTVWFDGDVHNLGSRSARVKLLVKAYSVNGTLLDSKSFYPDPDEILPGQRSHFNNFVESSTGDPIRKVVPEVVLR